MWYVPVIGVRGDMCDVGTVASGNEEAWPWGGVERVWLPLN